MPILLAEIKVTVGQRYSQPWFCCDRIVLMVTKKQNSAQTYRRQEQGSVGVVLLIVMTIAFFAAAGTALVLFSSGQKKQNDLSSQLAVAQKAAQDATVRADAAEKNEAEPFRSYQGSDTYGALNFEFPKFWNVYSVSSRSAILDFYAHPREIPGIGASVNFAFRAQILDKSYTSQLSSFENAAEKGEVKVRAFEPENVPSEAGVYIEGEVVRNKQGAMVLLPQRDKTFMFWTESEDHIDDFQDVMKTITYSP